MSVSDPVVIAGAARTPMGGFQGELSAMSAAELGGVAVRAALEGAGVAPDQVDEIVMGNVLGAGQGQAPARQAAFAAGIRRIAPSYWVQTPSPRFPVEAHTGVPFYWQRSERQRRRRLDRWYRTMPVWAEMIENTRVLGMGRMHQLFPDGQLWRERLAGIEKSLCMYRPGDATLRRARLADPV